MTENDGWASGNLLNMLDQAREYAGEYIESLRQRPVYPSRESLEKLSLLDIPMPEAPTDSSSVLEQLHQVGSLGTVAQTSGRYFGFVDGGMLPIGLAARWLADTWDQNTAHYVMSPVNSHLEDICEKWLVDLFEFPAGTAAGFVTGTTMANFSGLCAGRNELLKRQGWDVAKQGLYGAPRIRVIVGEGAHAAVYKSISMLGLGTDSMEVIPADADGRMRPDLISNLDDDDALVVAQIGNVNSGAFDPVGQICDLVKNTNSWVHVDGAFGLWGRVLPSLKIACDGLEKADSWSVDAHKTLNVPYDSGIILCKNRKALNDAFTASASYFQWSEHRDGMNYTPSMSKRARVIELWAVLRSLGRSGVRQLVQQLCDVASMFAGKLESEGFRLHNKVDFNQVLVSCGNDALTRLTLERIQSDGECWCGGSEWNGKNVIRVSVCDWSTTTDDVDRSIAAFVAARKIAEQELAKTSG